MYVVATPIGNLQDITLRALAVLRAVDVVAAEDTRHTAQLLSAHGINARLMAAHEHNEARAAAQIVDRLAAGEQVAFVSDAGTPGISDPGARLVAQVRAAGHPVVPVPGPSAMAAAMSVAGFADTAFHFVGFLPPKRGARQSRLQALAAAPEALVGLKVLDTTDAAGNPLFREMIDATRVTQEATVRYVWLNRATNKVEPKVSYVRKLGQYVVGVGYSAPRASADDARAMLDRAVAVARSEGGAQAAARFNDRRGEFVKDDLYVFMVNMESGRFEAMGMNPALSDTDALGLRDAAGNALVAEMIARLQKADEATVDYVWRNPVTNAVENKRSYVRKVGTSLVGVGHYLE